MSVDGVPSRTSTVKKFYTRRIPRRRTGPIQYLRPHSSISIIHQLHISSSTSTKHFEPDYQHNVIKAALLSSYMLYLFIHPHYNILVSTSRNSHSATRSNTMGCLSDWKKGKSSQTSKTRKSKRKSKKATKSLNQDSKVDKSKKDVKSATANTGGHEHVIYQVNYDSDDENEALCLENIAKAGGGKNVSHHVNYDSDD